MTRNYSLHICLAATAALVLVACGGGNGSTRPPDDASLRTLIDATAPVESPGAQSARAPAIVSRADSLVLSTVYGTTDRAELRTFRIDADCDGTRCVLRERRTGYSEVTRLSDFRFVSGESRALGTKRGVTIVSGTARDGGVDYTTLGAWLHHSAFGVGTQVLQLEDVSVEVRYGLAGGDLTGSRPTGGASWVGVMVGRIATGRADRLVGTAALNIALDTAETIDVAFSDIKNIDRGAAHTTETLLFEDLSIDSRGTFAAGLTGNRIQGGFYGPGHREAAGVFEQANIVGAFGATKR